MSKSLNFNLKSFRNLIYGFLPSKYVFLTGIIFYLLGFVFAVLNPYYAYSVFNGGFFMGSMEVKLAVPESTSIQYLINQFVNYLGAVSFHIFLNNLLVSFICIFTGIAIIPSILIGLFSSMGAVTFLLVMKVGVIKAVLMLLGSFHLYLEFLAALLSIDAFLKFYGSFIRALRMKSPQKFKNEVIKNFIPLILKIIVLLAFAAVLEVFWSTWWVYILNHPYVSWYDFYFGVYSALVL
jgi:hypothetical protein